MLAFAACGDDSSSTDETAAAPTRGRHRGRHRGARRRGADRPAPAEGDAGVKVTGKLGAEPKIEVPVGGTPPTGLLYKDLKVGKGPKAAAGQTVDVQYSGALLKDGTKFDASWDRGGEPF